MMTSDSLSVYIHGLMEREDITSIRGLAERAGVAIETARRLLTRPDVTPDEQTLKRVSFAFHAPIEHLRVLAGLPAGDRGAGRFELPLEADQLDEHQRDVVRSVVFALLDASGRKSGRLAVDLSVSLSDRLVGRMRDPIGADDLPDDDHQR